MQESNTCGFCGVGTRKTRVHVYTRGKKYPKVLSSFIFAPKVDEQSVAVKISLKAAAKGSNHAPLTNVPLKRIVCKGGGWVLKHCRAYHARKGHAVALGVRAEFLVASLFRAKYVVSATGKRP